MIPEFTHKRPRRVSVPSDGINGEIEKKTQTKQINNAVRTYRLCSICVPRCCHQLYTYQKSIIQKELDQPIYIFCLWKSCVTMWHHRDVDNGGDDDGEDYDNDETVTEQNQPTKKQNIRIEKNNNIVMRSDGTKQKDRMIGRAFFRCAKCDELRGNIWNSYFACAKYDAQFKCHEYTKSQTQFFFLFFFLLFSVRHCHSGFGIIIFALFTSHEGSHEKHPKRKNMLCARSKFIRTTINELNFFFIRIFNGQNV